MEVSSQRTGGVYHSISSGCEIIQWPRPSPALSNHFYHTCWQQWEITPLRSIPDKRKFRCLYGADGYRILLEVFG